MSATAQVSEKMRVGFKQILIATDFSAASERATECAVAIARHYGSQVTLAHALAPEPREPILIDSPRELDAERFKAEQQMRQFAEKTAKLVVSRRQHIERGCTWDVLSSLIKREDVDLLVLGTHGRGGVTKLALGSVAEEVLRQAECPVLTVGPNVANAGSAKFRCILFATDFGSASAKAFPYALSLAENQGSKLILLHMFPLLPALATAAYAPAVCAAQELDQWQASAKQESLKKLQKLVPDRTKLAVPPEYVVGTDFLPEGILNTAAKYKVDLIVMGVTPVHSAHIVSHIPSAVSYQVIREASCPVLTVRG